MNLFNALKATAQSAKSYVDKKVLELYNTIDNMHPETFFIPEGVETITREYAQNIDVNVTTIIFPESVKTIKSYAFDYRPSLEKVIFLGNGLTTIETFAFSNCVNLTQINIPSSVTTIGINILYGCFNLTKLTTPFIGATSFNSGLEYFFGGRDIIPSSLESVTITGDYNVPDYAFNNCKNLKYVYLTGNPESLGENAFSNCYSLERIGLPSSVKSILREAFANCINLQSIDLTNVTSIDDYAFSGCTSLAEVQLGSNLTTVNTGVFSSCVNLTEIVIPDSVNAILDDAFLYCNRLYRVSLGENIKEVSASKSFLGCYRLVEIFNRSDVEIELGDSSALGGIAAYALNIATVESERGTFAESNECVFYTTTTGIVYMIDYIGENSTITLPSGYNGEQTGLVFSLNQYALFNTSATILNTGNFCYILNSYCFAGAYSLREVRMNDAVQTIQKSTVLYSSMIHSITFDNKYWLLEAGGNEFEWEASSDPTLNAQSFVQYRTHEWQKITR